MCPTAADQMPEWLRQRARLSPDRLAIVSATARVTFAELDRLVAATARGLAAAGVEAGHRVALLARNGLEFVRVVHATARLGAVVVPLHGRSGARELQPIVHDCEPALLAYDAPSAAPAAALADMLPSISCVPIASLARRQDAGGDDHGAVGLERIALSAVHSILYTSGTTGAPKGALLTFGNHLWSATGSALNLGLRDDDCWLACLPLYHVGGLSILLRSVLYGIPVVLHDRFDAAAVHRDICEKGVTIVSVVSTMLLRILEQADENDAYPPSLRCVLVGGGPVPRLLLEACARRGVPVVQTYGLTEAASQVSTLAPADALGHLGSAGKPLFPTEVRIVDRDGRALAPGRPGQILVRGPTVTPGYLNRPAETEAVLRGGWLHTSDVGHLDGDGYLYVRDRLDGVIVSGGENVFAAEVEEVLCEHPAIEEAGVTGMPDTQWGQCVVATVSLRAGAHATEDELRAFCRSRLAPYKVPKRVRFTKALPRNEAGKLLRYVLRDMA